MTSVISFDGSITFILKWSMLTSVTFLVSYDVATNVCLHMPCQLHSPSDKKSLKTVVNNSNIQSDVIPLRSSQLLNKKTILHTLNPHISKAWEQSYLTCVKHLESALSFDSFISFILNATAGLTPVTAMCSAVCPSTRHFKTLISFKLYVVLQHHWWCRPSDYVFCCRAVAIGITSLEWILPSTVITKQTDLMLKLTEIIHVTILYTLKLNQYFKNRNICILKI